MHGLANVKPCNSDEKTGRVSVAAPEHRQRGWVRAINERLVAEVCSQQS